MTLDCVGLTQSSVYGLFIAMLVWNLLLSLCMHISLIFYKVA